MNTTRTAVAHLTDVVAEGQTVRVHGPGSLTFVVTRDADGFTITHERLGGVARSSLDTTMIVNRVEVLS